MKHQKLYYWLDVLDHLKIQIGLKSIYLLYFNKQIKMMKELNNFKLNKHVL